MMQVVIEIRSDCGTNEESFIMLFPETNEEMAQVKAFAEDGLLAPMRIKEEISDNKRAVYFKIDYDRGIERGIPAMR